MFECNYCLSCGEWVLCVNGEHMNSLTRDEFLNWQTGYCSGPFAFCPPDVELDLDGWEFIMSLPVPDELELAQMNLSAEELRLQFEGE